MEPVYRTLEMIALGLRGAQGVRIDYRGAENIPTSGGAVLAINHTGYMDFIPVALGVYRRGRRIRFMIKSEMMDIAIMRFLITRTKTVPVDRSAGHEAYEAAVAELRDGELLGVYPEATISRSFEIKELKSGAVRMAAAAGVPIIPIICWGAHRQWTKGGIRSMGRKKIPVIVEYGTPIDLSAVDLDSTTSVDAKVSELRDTMISMLHPIQEEYDHPAGAPWVPARLGGSAPTFDEAKVIEDEEAANKAAARAAKRESGRR
ncbi:putative acyltransferase [Gordonia araii NBRC 100433]|uniref:Putative acyltransferase n=1 Tax=Gordonia araii NBRC 100433 TaxID=1073574 RepID=G7H1Y0_9ACTN|nr:lysophospholipid acyltransferase family protein [Gordonia araii]NNG97188.1 1-acyl-sn-glycerol-3-phosphate acyltransferase [Gordonia araii NBRC 100433]GAB09855.1 putative acyltransferase [Gordonia araii NBRC 100433]